MLTLGVDETKHDVHKLGVLLLQYNLARLSLLQHCSLALQSRITLGMRFSEDNTDRHVSVESSLEPLASGAQDHLVDLPSSVAADDGGISEVSGLEEKNIVVKAEATVGFGHLELRMW